MVSPMLLLLSMGALMICLHKSRNPLGQIFISGLLLVTFTIFIGELGSNSTNLLSSLLVFMTSVMLTATVFIFNPSVRSGAKKKLQSTKIFLDFSFFVLPILIILLLFGRENVANDWQSFREFRQNNQLVVIVATMFFFVGVSRLFLIEKKSGNYFSIITGASLLFIFVYLTREKIFFVPIILATFLDPMYRRFSHFLLLLFGFNFFILYYLSTAVRWYGSFSNGFDAARFSNVLLRAIQSGFESHVHVQYTSVMQYFHTSDYLGPVALVRLFAAPIDRIFKTQLSPDNPIYLYAIISNSSENAIASSAHPTIYADFYGQVGFLMIFLVPLVYVTIVKLSLLELPVKSVHYLAPGLFIFIALILRGSSFYALFYLALSVLLVLAVYTFKRIMRIIK